MPVNAVTTVQVVNQSRKVHIQRRMSQVPEAFCGDHRCDKRLQRLQKILCKRVYYFVNVYVNKNHMSETKQKHRLRSQ